MSDTTAILNRNINSAGDRLIRPPHEEGAAQPGGLFGHMLLAIIERLT